MKTNFVAAALVVAMVGSTAALAAPRGNPHAESEYNVGELFNCVVPLPGPVRLGPCWLNSIG